MHKYYTYFPKGIFIALFLLIHSQLLWAGGEHIGPKGSKIETFGAFVGLKYKDVWLITPEYKEITYFDKNLITLKTPKNTWQFASHNGIVLPIPSADTFYIVKDTLLVLSYNHKWGMYSVFGKKLLPIVYKDITVNAYGITQAEQFNQYTIWNKAAAFVFDADQLEPANEQYYSYKYNSIAGVMKSDGLPLLTGDSLATKAFIQSLRAKHTTKTRKPTCEELEAVYHMTRKQVDNIVTVYLRGKVIAEGPANAFTCRCTDSMLVYRDWRTALAIVGPKKLQVLERFQKYDLVDDYHDGNARVKRDGKWGFIDRTGGLFVATQYDTVSYCSQGRAAVWLKGRWAYVDMAEKLIAQPYYDSVSLYIDSSAIVKRDGKYGMLDYNGTEIAAAKYSRMKRIGTGLYLVERNRKQGIMNSRGREVVFTRFDEIVAFNTDYVVIKEYGKYGLVDWKGNTLISADHDLIALNPYNKQVLIVKKGYRETYKF